ncbi:hypothetical protein TNCV_2684621 [Trichonephila clavipes]|nr:hypothetical protein TNCV_2684621 [Trichonephila clavipes]
MATPVSSFTPTPLGHEDYMESVTSHYLIRCPLIPYDAATECNIRKTTNGASNGATNGGYGQRNGTTFCLLKNPASACNFTVDETVDMDSEMERDCVY